MKQLSEYSHIIFDFDETLATFHVDWPAWERGVAEIIKKYEPDAQLTLPIPHAVFNAYVEKYGDPLRLELWKYSADHEVKTNQGLTPNDTALAALSQLRPDQKAYLYTSNSRAVIMPALAMLGIAERFAAVITRDDVSFIKPHPDGFAKIHDGETPLSEYVMVGDSSSDEGVAKNAGIDFIHVSQV